MTDQPKKHCDICNEPTTNGFTVCVPCWKIQSAVRGPDNLARLVKILSMSNIILLPIEDKAATKFLKHRNMILRNAKADHPDNKLFEHIDTDFPNHKMTYSVEVGR